MATLFVLSFATSYAALHDYALQLQFGSEFAIVFPLVLDAVISVLAVTVLLERALRRRTVTVRGWQFARRLPTWPLFALWCYFGGSVAGNVAHAPSILPAQLVAAVPPISSALTFHLLLRLLDRAPALREIAEAYEERSVEEQERAAIRRARRAELKTRRTDRSEPRVASALSGTRKVSNNGGDGQCALEPTMVMEQPTVTRLLGNPREWWLAAPRQRSTARGCGESAATCSGSSRVGRPGHRRNRWAMVWRVRPHRPPPLVTTA